MPEEPFFLVNEFLEKEKKELENVLKIINIGHSRNIEKAIFIRNFTNEVFRAHKKTKRFKLKEGKKDLLIKNQQKDLLERRKQELLNKLKEAELKIKTQELAIEIPIPTSENKNLILSKETGRALVTTEFNGTQYYVKEPEITEADKNIIKEMKRITRSISLEDKQKFMEKLKDLCSAYNVDYTNQYYDKIRYFVVRDLKKYSIVSPLVEDKSIKEIVCSGSTKPITITYKDQQDIPTNIAFNSDRELNDFIKYLAAKATQRVSEENPFLNTAIGGINIQATFGSEFVKPKFVITRI